ncbi:dynein axonemal assembly factor 3-like [Clavelina lepadiformis]|uniref:dynein axonemal assembly factor 3-like n=1 Tax=Clavelina lepadiformis TaxID=159417 RepID=UPI004043432B
MSGEGFGTVTMWGFTPALDFQAEICGCDCISATEEGVTHDALDVVNILMIGAGDCRHILKTAALRKRHKKRKIHIYVVENNLELLGKHLLLFTLSLEPAHRMGLQEKVELFAELYGNTLIRQQTVQYLQEKANLFIEMITDLDYSDERMPTIDLSQLKYKERDYLEGIFKFWREPDMRHFNVSSMWDSRLRQYLATRYDERNGAYDWDLSMKLHDLGAKMMTKAEYFRWRETGVAFEAREGIYDRPNKSMASGILLKRRDGERVPCRGYWGDMVTGPYIAFGVDTEEKSLLKTANGKPVKNSADISLHNLTAIFHELQSGTHYEPAPEENDKKEPKIMELDEIVDTEEHCDGETEMDHAQTQGNKEFYAPIPCEEVCVHFLSLNSVADLHKKSKFKNLFNTAFISASMVQVLTPDLRHVFAEHATLTIELVKYILDLNKSQVEGFAARVSTMAQEAGFQPVPPANNIPQSVQGCFAKFELVRS